MHLQTHDFGALLKHKSGMDSWILLHPDERERRWKLALYPMATAGRKSVCICTPLYTCGLSVSCNSLGPAKRILHTGVVQRPTPVIYRYNICRLAPTTQP